MIFDYAVIGGGVVGSAIFNKLVRKKKKVVLIEKELDIATGATKANSGLVHAGFDAETGSLKAKLNVIGNKMMDGLCKELLIEFKKCGAVVVGNDKSMLQNLLERGNANGVDGLKIVEGQELRDLVPNLAQEIQYALYAPSAGLVSPYMLAIALAEEGVINGGVVKLDFKTVKVLKDKNIKFFSENNEMIETKNVINCAGAGFNEISKLLNAEEYDIQFRKGEYIVLDKSDFVKLSVFPLPTKLGKGILATPTIDGNILFGPTAEEQNEYNTETTEDGIEKILQYIKSNFKNVPLFKNIRQFAGVRVSVGKDFVIEKSVKDERILNVAGINSPGLTAAPAIAQYVCELLNLKEEDKEMTKRQKYISNEPSPVVCRCEKVCENEIKNAINAPIPAQTVDAVKRRVRAGMGRCQGGQCMLTVCKLIARECNVEFHQVKKESKHSEVMYSGEFL